MVKDGSGQDYSQAEGLVFVRKTSISPRSTWIQMDATGHSSLLDADMYDIMHRAQIDARDLRILDPFLSYPSTIIGREKAIVINLEVLLFVFIFFTLIEFCFSSFGSYLIQNC